MKQVFNEGRVPPGRIFGFFIRKPWILKLQGLIGIRSRLVGREEQSVVDGFGSFLMQPIILSTVIHMGKL
jgi:hypothetical protein